MPLPAGLSTVTVTGTALRPGTGEPLIGRITFTPDVPQIIDLNSGALLTGSVAVAPDGLGHYSATLLAPDSQGVTPTGWTYRVEMDFIGVDPSVFHVTLTKSTPNVNITDLMHVGPKPGSVVGATSIDGDLLISGQLSVTGPVSMIVPPHASRHATGGLDPVTPAAIGAEPTGTATSAVSAHTAAADPHGDRSFATGSAASAVSAHTAATDPHGDRANAAATYAPLSRTARSGLGINVPAGWGANWRAKLAAAQAGTGKAVMATVGGSSTQGYYASNLRQKGWVDLLRASLQGTYGDGGSGFRGAGLTGVVQAADGVPAAATTAYNANGTNATLTGSWSVGGNSYGPGAKYVFTSTVGDSYSISVRGTQVDIYIVAGSSAPHTTFSYQIDGGAVVTVPTTGTADNIQKTTITGLSAGTHSVVVRHAGTAGQFVSVCGVAGTYSTGTVINNFARYGSRAQNFAATDSTINTDWNGAFQYPADLVILAHAPNDVNNGALHDTAVEWSANMVTIMDRIRSNGGALGATDVMIVLPHIGTFETTNVGYYRAYSEAAVTLTATYGCALVNMWTVGRNSWAYWNSLGYWSNSSNPGPAGTDNVHPSDAGHQFIYNTIFPIINGV